MDGDVKGSRTLSMKVRHERDGWICSKVKEAILHNNVEIRVVLESMANEWRKS